MSSRRRSDPGLGPGTPLYPGTFLLAFREAAGIMRWQVRRWLGQMVECVDAEGRTHMVGVENLYRRARRAERADWPALVAEFLRTLDSASRTDNLPADLAGVADHLLVRLGQPLKGMSEESKVWSQSLSETAL